VNGSIRRERSRLRAALAVLALVVIAGAPAVAAAFDRSNIPLHNLGGFAVGRDALYDDLERLVTAGFADRSLLNTKPLSRIEAARMVARAIERIRANDRPADEDRRDLEPVLDRLMAELRPELIALGVRRPNGAPPGPSLITYRPVDRITGFGAYATARRTLPASGARRFEDGFNAGTALESHAQIGDVLTVFVQPEALANEDFASVRLARGYAKLTLWNIELMVGRENLWWGPGLRGSLILSNNAPPLDQIRIGAAEPFHLPFIGHWVGPTKALFFLAQLEERRDHPRAKLAGMRVTASPFTWLEVGISRTTQFGGDDPPTLDPEDYPRVLLDPEAGDPGTPAKFRSNNQFAIDADFRIPNVHRWLPVTDARVYGEFGWDDTCCQTAFVPLAEATSALLGVQFMGLFGKPIDTRFEFTDTSRLSYTHHQFRSGYWTRGEVLAHAVGVQGREYFSRVQNWLTPNVMLGLELVKSEAGTTARALRAPKERRLGGGADVSYRFSDDYTLFVQYNLHDVENRDFRARDDGLDHLMRIQLTRTFR
jgi:hypothetical protein